MDAELRKEKWVEFLKVMTGADAELLQQASFWMYTNLKTFGVDLPFETHCEGCKTKLVASLKGAMVSYATVNTEPAVPASAKTILTGGVHKVNDPKWIPVMEAPKVKLKAYNPISLHIPKGAKVMLKSGSTGKVIGFTKLHVKLISDLSGATMSKLYSSVSHVAV